MSSIETALSQLAERIRKHADTISTEEAAKTSIVLPFLQVLGYDVFDPSEVVPEFTADAVGKKGEKVDYAIRLNGEVAILIECKGLATTLDRKHLSQLYRYFSVTKARFALLTNGRVYEFYSDLEEPNKLDIKPFFTLDLLDLNSRAISELSKFDKAAFDVKRILSTAEKLKYVSGIKKLIAAQLEEPSEEFVRLIASNVYEGRLTQAVRENLAAATKVAFTEFIRESVQARLSSALQSSTNDEPEAPEIEPDTSNDIVTTQEEIEGMLTVRSIVRDIVAPSRVNIRDAKTYCAILVDDNNRKPLARMHFNRKQWYLGLFDGDTEERVAISSLTDIYDLSDRIRETARRYSE
ncbi:type I restriction endonuclease [Sagittula sp. S175]|uniref:type I restriction endonuclease n=1 Tax=Sagittula sp. S175 TaxID=3415129 RepID=UPI003C7E360F